MKKFQLEVEVLICNVNLVSFEDRLPTERVAQMIHCVEHCAWLLSGEDRMGIFQHARPSRRPGKVRYFWS
jgi:hypothetical protein